MAAVRSCKSIVMRKKEETFNEMCVCSKHLDEPAEWDVQAQG